MKAGQYKTDAAITPATTQDIHAKRCPKRMCDKICQLSLFSLLLHFFRCQCRIEIQLIKIVIPITVRIVNNIFFRRQLYFFIIMMELRMHKARYIRSLGWNKPHHIIRKPAAMTQGLLPKIIKPGIAISVAPIVFFYQFDNLSRQSLGNSFIRI